MSEGPIAVLGAGVMGGCLALALAARGRDVALFDRAAAPLEGASRWNEGKIHLGYLYGSDSTLETARRVMPNGLRFADALAALTGCDVRSVATQGDDVFLIHRDSVAAPDALAALYTRLDDLVRTHPDGAGYLADLSAARSHRLSAAELGALTDDPAIVAGFEVPERSVDTGWVADRIVAAIRAEPRIAFHGGVAIEGARPDDAGGWRLTGGPDLDARFAVVVNALWEGRPSIDATAGLAPDAEWLHRYRLALFVRTTRPVTARCALVAVGPFGDLKSYDVRNFYLSWYPAGLIAQGSAIAPPAVPALDPAQEAALAATVGERLGALMPAARDVLAAAETIRVRGGWVFAHGSGSLGDAGSTLHRRDRFGVRRLPGYFSVDTGKYSTAPQMALDLAAEVAAA